MNVKCESKFVFYSYRPKKARTIEDSIDDAPSDGSDHEEEFYYTEIEDEGESPSPPSPPTLSHRDMARPPHEDPEYQRQIVGSIRYAYSKISNSILILFCNPMGLTSY